MKTNTNPEVAKANPGYVIPESRAVQAETKKRCAACGSSAPHDLKACALRTSASYDRMAGSF